MRRLPTLLALGALLLAAPASALTVVQITSNVSTNTTWGPTGSVAGDVFWVRNSIGVDPGVTLTVQPGAIVKFDLGRSITVNGALRCLGTPAQNVYFTSIRDDNVGGDTNGDGPATTPQPSDWQYLYFPDGSPDFASALYYCDIRFGGAGNAGAVTFVSASDSLQNCFIRRSYFGVDCQGTAAPVLSGTSIEASTLTPLVLDFTATPVLSSLVFSSANNGYDAFGLRGGTLVGGTTATLPKRGATVGANPVSNVTYVLFGSLTINPGASLAISPGVVVKPFAGVGITVGGNLTLNGTAAVGDTITITSLADDNFGQPNDTNNNGSTTAPNRGDWNRIVFQQGATGSVSYCRLKFGTNSATQGVVEMMNNSIGVSNCLLSDAAHGLAAFGVSNPAVTNVAINNMSSTPVLQSVSANPAYTGVSLLANALTAIGLQGEGIAVDSHLIQRQLGGFTNITYYIMNGAIWMQSPAVLTIDAGIVVKNQLGGGGMQIDGGLVAAGTVAQPIVFTSERDDNYGNPLDTNGDAGTTTAAQGNWTYIHFTATTNDAVSKLDHCLVLYGSYGPFDGYPTNVWLTSAAPPITNCTISKGGYGIRLDGDSSPLISANAITNCSAAPIVMSVLSNPNIATNNTYSTNGYNALALLSETLAQNARIRYRPGVGTPTFAYLPTGTITVASGVTLSVDPQVVLKPSGAFTLFDVFGALNMVGSDNTTGRIIVTSRRDDNPAYGGDTTPLDASGAQAGDWGRIYFEDVSVDAACIVRNVLFQFGGSGGNDYGVVSTLSASPKIAGDAFFQNGTALTFAANSKPSCDSLDIFNCTTLPIVFSLISDPSFAHITFANNSYLALGILDETVAQDVTTRVRSVGGYSNLNYALSGNLAIAFGAKWTIAPGVVVKMGRFLTGDPIGGTINVDGALVASGTPDSLIVFTSSADDGVGQDVKADGALTQPAPGQWGYISFSAISNDAVNLLNHCQIRYGDYFGAGAIQCTSAAPTITNSIITRSYGFGLGLYGDSSPVLANVNIDSTATGPPVQMSLVTNPTFTNVQFLGNAFTALGVYPETIAQDVLWPIRAVSGRNNMPYLLQGQLTISLGATLAMQPGVIVKSRFGSIVVQRAMQAEGRSVQPESLVVFTSYRDDFYGGDTNMDGSNSVPAAGDWYGIDVDGTAIDPECRFRNCVFRYGGWSGSQGVLRAVNSSPTADSCLFAFNSVGISAEGASNPRVHECSIYGNTYFGIDNTGGSFCVDADSCWWGAANGPNDPSATADLCGLGSNAGGGDPVSDNVDYTPFKTAGIVNPLLGDVSLNGFVRAYDASLVFQANVSLITLSPLQQSVADVNGNDTIEGFDGVLILQWVAGIIKSFPAASNDLKHAPPDVQRALERAQGTFQVTLGEPRREGDEWLVPVLATGDAPVWSVEVRVAGGAAATLTGVTPTDQGRALSATNVVNGEGLLSMGAAEPLTDGEVAVLRFPAGSAPFEAPQLEWARVNATVVPVAGGPRPVTPVTAAFLSAAAPNPAGQAATLRLGVSSREAGLDARVVVRDLAGRTVRMLVRGPLPAGEHPIVWDLRDDAGRAVPAGLYFVDARAGAFRAQRRLSVVR